MLSNLGLPVSRAASSGGPSLVQCPATTLLLRPFLLRLPLLLSHCPSKVPHQPPPYCGPKGPSKVAPRIWSVEIYIGVIQLLCSGVVDAIRRRQTAPTFGFAAGTFLFATVFCGLHKWMEVNGCDWERVGTGRPGPLRAIGVNEGE